VSQLSFPILSAERYTDATNRAKALIRERAEEPAWDTFARKATQVYPRWFTTFVLAALIGVMVFSFTVSAGKQIASTSMLFDALPGKFNHLSTLWSNTSIAFMLLLSELGAVLFLISAGTIAHDAPKWRGVNLVAWMFRGFAGLCAAYAVVGNVSVTLLDPVPAVSVLQWLESVGIPVTVLGLGTLMERMVVDALAQRGKNKAEYEVAQADYQALLKDPTRHSAWGEVLTNILYEEMTRLKRHRELIEGALEEIGADNPQVKAYLVAAEIQAHANHNALNVEASANPFLSAGSPQTLPLLSAENSSSA
jgi:hypothetical protein